MQPAQTTTLHFSNYEEVGHGASTGFPADLAELVGEGFDLTTLQGIGKDLSEKIIEIVQTGELAFVKELKKSVSSELEPLLKIPGLGPKRVRLLHEKLKIDSLHDLKAALRKGKLEKTVL